MSAQTGIWNFEGELIDVRLLIELSKSISEYGPDGEKTYLNHNIGIVFRPLHTTSESYLEHQPYICSSGRIITWDGRLDNRKELIGRLCNDMGESVTDVAIVAATIRRWGTGAFARLTGDWALSVWDPSEKILILARDYIGCRRLFYYQNPRKVIWSSCLTALTQCGERLSLCNEYIAGDLSLHIAGHLTPFQEIYSVPAGGFVRIREGHVAVHRYWAFEPGRKTRYTSDAEYEEEFRFLFRQAVRRRLRSQSPVLADLSGGYDSSSIVCMADDILNKEGAKAPRLDTFSYSYVDEPEGDDVLYFTKVEERIGRTGHHAQISGSGDSFSTEFPKSAATPVFLGRREVDVARSEVIKRGEYRVTLSGIGGDEFLGQSLDPHVVMGDSLVQLRLGALVKQLASWSVLLRRSWVQLLEETLVRLAPTTVRALIEKEGRIEPWLNSKFARKYRISRLLLPAAQGPWFWRPSGKHFVQKHAMLVHILNNYPPRYAETRYPFLDQNLAEYLMSVPSDQLYRPGNRRSLMRRALAGILPAGILTRRTKQIESRCYCLTVRKHWRTLEAMFASPFSSSLGYINRSQFESTLVDVKAGKMPPNSNLFLTALFLELWLRDVVSRRLVLIPTSSQEVVASNPEFLASAHPRTLRLQ